LLPEIYLYMQGLGIGSILGFRWLVLITCRIDYCFCFVLWIEVWAPRCVFNLVSLVNRRYH
jgi:hypothetical protein